MKDARDQLVKIAAQNAVAAINPVESSLSDIKPISNLCAKFCQKIAKLLKIKN